MIEFLSSCSKSLGLSIVIVSILEMILPNNKTKKYIRMVMGIYILFSIISPFIDNKDLFDLNNLNLESIKEVSGIETETDKNKNVNQTSMNERIEELYVQELEKDIKKKLKNEGYQIKECKVSADIKDEDNETKITKIRLKLNKLITQDDKNENENESENIDTTNQDNQENNTTQKEETIENRIVTEIQKIKKVDTSISKSDTNSSQSDIEDNENAQNTQQEIQEERLNNVDIENVKKFLIEEYGVSEECLEIN